jgi:hypothetical protein
VRLLQTLAVVGLIVVAHVVTALTRLFPTTAASLHARQRAAARRAERLASDQVALITPPLPPVVDEGRDLGCTIHSPAGFGFDHNYVCRYVHCVYFLGDDRDPRDRVRDLAAAIQAAGWSFARGTIGTPPMPWMSEDWYDAFQRDPAHFSFPIAFERPDVPREVRLALDLVTSRNVGWGGRSTFQQGLIDPFRERIESGRYLCGYSIELVYARGTCYLCESTAESERRMARDRLRLRS